MAPLVAVPDKGMEQRQGSIDRVQDKRHLQGLIESPGNHIPGKPVDDRHEIHPAPEEPDVGDIDSPDVVGISGHRVPEEIRIDLMLQSPLAEIGTGVNPFDPHFPHGSLDGFSSHRKSVQLKDNGNPAASVKRPAGVNLVDPVFELDFRCRGPNWPIIQSRPGDSDQPCLQGQGKVGVGGRDQTSSRVMAQPIPD